jgi:hypothetical protein
MTKPNRVSHRSSRRSGKAMCLPICKTERLAMGSFNRAHTRKAKCPHDPMYRHAGLPAA